MVSTGLESLIFHKLLSDFIDSVETVKINPCRYSFDTLQVVGGKSDVPKNLDWSAKIESQVRLYLLFESSVISHERL